MSASERLAALGIELPAVTAPIGAYVPAVRHAGLVVTSGQLPLVAGALVASGRLGAEVSTEAGAECAKAAVINAIAAAADAAGGVDNIVRVIRVVGYVASTPEFTAQPAVVNGASNLLIEVFGEAGRHARSAVGVAALPLGAPVEIELHVAITD